jgi:DNA primase
VAKLLREAKPLIPFVLEMIVSMYNLNDPHTKEAAFGAVKQYLDTLSPIIKDSYIPTAATLIGLSPSFFGKEARPDRARDSFRQSRDDSAHLQIIKTLIENPNLIDNVLNVMDVTMFESYAPLVTALISGENENPGLIRLSLDDSLDILTEEKLNKELCALLLKQYNLKLKNIASSQQIPFEKKSFLIRKIRTDIIPRLKKGELVAFEAGL